MSKRNVTGFLLAATAMALSVPAADQTLYRYVDANGKFHYTDRPPTDNTGRAMDKMSRGGNVTAHVPAAPTAEERAAAEAERKRKAEDEAAQRVENRRTQAILSAYASEQDIDSARASALRPVQEIIRESEAKLADLDKRLKDLRGGNAAPNDAKAATKAPVMAPKNRMEIQRTESEYAALEQLLEAKRKEERAINTRYDEDKRRFVEGTRARAAQPKQPIASTSSATPKQ
jgi:hypothetical protein